MAPTSLLASASAAWSPTPDGHEPPSFTKMISLMANEAFPSRSGLGSQQPHVAMAATPGHPGEHLGHVATRGIVNLATTAVESVPDYLIAVVMVLIVVLVFACFWGRRLDHVLVREVSKVNKSK